MITKGITNIQIRTVDTDVIVILLAFMAKFIEVDSNASLVVDFGTGEHRRSLSINHSFDKLGESVCSGLPFFHAFTGCDSTSSF